VRNPRSFSSCFAIGLRVARELSIFPFDTNTDELVVLDSCNTDPGTATAKDDPKQQKEESGKSGKGLLARMIRTSNGK